MIRRPLCTYYSPQPEQLLQELQTAYSALPTHCPRGTESPIREHQRHKLRQCTSDTSRKLLALVAPHGAACDGFYVAAHAYRELNEYCKRVRCQHLTAVLLGTQHQGTTPIALSRKDFWSTPLGQIPVDTSAVDYLAQQHNIPVNESPHTAEHSIENQLPFLQHGAICNWDPTVAAAAVTQTASVSIVSISVGYLGHQPGLIQQYGAAVADLLQHLHTKQQHQQQQGTRSSSGSHGTGREVTVLIITTDFSHAGPWYKELPPTGVSLEDYMRTQDTPVLQAVQQGSVETVVASAAANHNSMCGLYPLAVGLEALYGSTSDGRATDPELLEYKQAHLLFPRADSTGFAAFAVYQDDAQYSLYSS